MINGAAGGVGTFAVQIAKSLGAKVTGVCSTRNVEMVRSLGADLVIDYTQEEFTDSGQRYDLILDNVGNRSLSALRRIMTPRGRCVMAGAPKELWAVVKRVLKAFVWSAFLAAQVIANLAPPFLEETIIHMLDSERWSYLGVRGLRNLGTPSAHRALVAFVKNSEPTPISGAYQEAIRYIGEAGDRNDLDMLLEVAHSNPAESSSRELAIEGAGEVGGDDAVPLLARETKNPSIDTRQAAVRGLYLGGSRKAVPVLIELLRSPEERVNGTAEFGLQVLTHRFPVGTSTKENPRSAYLKWIHWWNTHRDTATIFNYDECGESLPFE